MIFSSDDNDLSKLLLARSDESEPTEENYDFVQTFLAVFFELKKK